MDRVALLWGVGRRIPRRVADALARATGLLSSGARLPAVDAWAETVRLATGVPPTPRQRRLLVENWVRNTLWSLSLARWGDSAILDVVDIDERDAARLHESLAGPGLVLALPHMGSWDFAGAWCARVGIKVVSVAERLPKGVYERFAQARGDMGMAIYPVDQPDVMTQLGRDVESRRLVCLLSDRDLSARGLKIPWPDSAETIGVPAGPALLALRTGADLRVATTHFAGGSLRIEISDRIPGQDPTTLMTGAVAVFADAVRRHPESWLMLRRVFR